MISLVDSGASLAASLTTALGAASAQIAGRPANISSVASNQTAAAASAAVSSEDVSISAEGFRLLQREQNNAAMDAAKIENPELVARMAYELAYAQAEPVGAAPTSLKLNSMTVKGAPASAAYAVSDAESRQEHARFARIALYEIEKARGTPPEQIYNKLQSIQVARPASLPA